MERDKNVLLYYLKIKPVRTRVDAEMNYEPSGCLVEKGFKD